MVRSCWKPVKVNGRQATDRYAQRAYANIWTNMAASDSYAVTATAKCGQEVVFSHVKCVDLNQNFNSLFDKLKDDEFTLDIVQIGAGPNGPILTFVF